MKPLFLIPLLYLVLFLSGCTSETDHVAVKKHEAEKPTPTLNLNNGDKWRADEFTTESIGSIQQALEKFNMQTEKSTAEDYKWLGQELQGELNSLYRNCTMTGAAHEELHKFLVPIEDDVKILQSGREGAAERAILRIEERLMMYQAFFE